jgi:hypothetical protein
MRILRHSKIAVTMEIYTEAPSEATRDALRKLSDWLARPVAALCCCTKIQKGRSRGRNRPLSRVGDTGIEPVTSSV